MDGWEFRRRQVEDSRLKKIPTIVVSAAGRDRLAQISADAYLSKPVDMDELLRRVSQFCPA
jgi:two-component system, OmpR family, response regulator CpxR